MRKAPSAETPETTPEIRKTAQILEMSQILGRMFKHSDERDAWNSFADIDTDGNGKIDMKELMAGLQKVGFTPKELKDLSARVTMLYEEGFELNFDLFCTIVCPDKFLDLGDLLLEIKFTESTRDGDVGELTITLQRAIDLVPMDDGGTSDPYVILKVGDKKKKSTVRPKTLNPIWNETFTFAVTSAMESEEVVMEVWDQVELSLFLSLTDIGLLGRLSLAVAKTGSFQAR